jgi:hypothetical protein
LDLADWAELGRREFLVPLVETVVNLAYLVWAYLLLRQVAPVEVFSRQQTAMTLLVMEALRAMVSLGVEATGKVPVVVQDRLETELTVLTLEVWEASLVPEVQALPRRYLVRPVILP